MYQSDIIEPQQLIILERRKHFFLGRTPLGTICSLMHSFKKGTKRAQDILLPDLYSVLRYQSPQCVKLGS